MKNTGTRRYVPEWRQAEPFRISRDQYVVEAVQIIVGVAVMGALIVGIPFLLWLAAVPR